MDKSEPSLVPEWLKINGGGSSSHHLASSDDPSLALHKRNRASKSISNPSGPHSSFLDRSSFANSWRSSNGSSKHDKNPYIPSYSSSNRNLQNKDRQSLDPDETWENFDYNDSLTSLIAGRSRKETLKRSQSMISRRPNELSQSQPKVFSDLRSKGLEIDDTTGVQKVSFDRDFPLLGSDERPSTPGISPRLSKGVQGLSCGTSALVCSEGWTSALAEVPIETGSSSISSVPTVEPPAYAAAAANFPISSTSGSTGTSTGLNMTGALVQPPARSQIVQQLPVQAQKLDELPFLGPKRLIPMTPSTPKNLVLNPSDKLKPKTAVKSNEAVSVVNNGLQQPLSLQTGSQPSRGGGTRSDGAKACSTVKLLKPVRENGLSAGQTINIPGFVPSKNPIDSKLIDKKCSLAQFQSRSDFFNLMRKKSTGNISAASDSGTVVSQGVQNPNELKEVAIDSPTQSKNGSMVKCNGIRENDLGDNADIRPDEEEEAFLRSLGWEDSPSDEGGLTEEEINSFVQKLSIMAQSEQMKSRSASKLCQGLKLKILTQSDPQVSCSTDTSCKLTADASL